MPRERMQIDLSPPLLRERAGCRSTGRSLSGRLAETVDRLAAVASAHIPDLPEEAWSYIAWEGAGLLMACRLNEHPRDVDRIAWSRLLVALMERQEPWAAAAAARLLSATPAERVAVLERIEAMEREQAGTQGFPDQCPASDSLARRAPSDTERISIPSTIWT
jgi:hypothetical protein